MNAPEAVVIIGFFALLGFLMWVISAYLVAHDIHVVGPRTITVNKELCDCGKVYVDPSGFVVHNGKKTDGRGAAKLTGRIK